MNQFAPAPKFPETGYLRLPDVLYFFPISKSAWWAGIKAGIYPAGYKLSARVTAWRAEDIRSLLQRGVPV
ncbi:helix-turn-helix transcriptional regulator [Noviherbaspirillum sedimenti]|uniref:AlpA family phage regulatory protein n=1 Tax=Noviherbaspirillum sedimenti TaxID=2320865 RepID=A0A3A3G3K7_9BURK|nr:AlpA family phage regulatory protein [Noviherbaspirillum sedimenti]RJG02521.1 AlpA family phage regulatory protein [Noviherbaspirillum sedimenti]